MFGRSAGKEGEGEGSDFHFLIFVVFGVVVKPFDFFCCFRIPLK